MTKVLVDEKFILSLHKHHNSSVTKDKTNCFKRRSFLRKYLVDKLSPVNDFHFTISQLISLNFIEIYKKK